MNQRKGANFPAQGPRQPQAARRPNAAPPQPPRATRPQTSGVAQPKAAAPAPARSAPQAPPVYRPQPAPKVLQAKKAVGVCPAPSGQSPRAQAAQRGAHGNVVQAKPSAQSLKTPQAPPAYRPEPRRVLQPKAASPASARSTPQAPAVYRPNPTPRVLQPKSPPGQSAPAARGLAPQPKAAQPKVAGPRAPRAFAPPRGGVLQRLTNEGGAGASDHIAYGDFQKSEAVLPKPGKNVLPTPLIIELLEPNPESAKSKIQQAIASKLHKRMPLAFVIAINANIGKTHEKMSGYATGVVNTKLDTLKGSCVTLTQFMEDNGIGGGCFPLVWSPTSIEEGGYTFPFLECRSILTLHPGVDAVHEQMKAFGWTPVVRGMDADVAQDPLLTGKASHPDSMSAKEVWRSLAGGLKAVSMGGASLFSGGYEWDVNGVTVEKLVALNVIKDNKTEREAAGPLVDRLKSLIAIVNINELEVREKLTAAHHKSVYWPEPNVYMSLDLRVAGANNSVTEAKKLRSGEAQQKESTHYVKSPMASTGKFSGTVSTRKPLKTYFDDFIKFFAAAYKTGTKPSATAIAVEVAKIRQTHLDILKVRDALKWHGAYDESTNNKVTPVVAGCLRECAEAIHSVFVPTNYVSGYIPTVPPPGEGAKLMGL